MKRGAKRRRHKLAPVARLHELLAYDPDTGVLTGRVRLANGKSKPGQRAGSVARSSGGARWAHVKHLKRHVRVDGVLYLEHHVIWAMMKGRWARHEIDHEDTDATNNRWTNLRRATYSQNQRNRGINDGPRRTNQSGLKWVRTRRDRPRSPYQAAVCGVYLGSFKTAEAAHQAAAAYARKTQGKFFNPGRREPVVDRSRSMS